MSRATQISMLARSPPATLCAFIDRFATVESVIGDDLAALLSGDEPPPTGPGQTILTGYNRAAVI